MSILLNHNNNQMLDTEGIRRWCLVLEMIKGQKELIDAMSEEYKDMLKLGIRRTETQMIQRIQKIVTYTEEMRELIQWLSNETAKFGTSTGGMIKIPLDW